MEEELVSLETAKIAKEKGFKELCFAAFHKSNDNISYFESGIMDQKNYFKFPTMSNGDKIAVLQKDYIHTILRPTQSLLQKWLRDTYNINCSIQNRLEDNKIVWEFCISIMKEKFSTYSRNNYKSYEEALEAALLGSLGLINSVIKN